MSKLFNTEDDIVVLATPFLNSALCIIRSSGPLSIEKFKNMFSNPEKLENADGHTIHYGYILDNTKNELLDEILVSLYRAPKTWTGQNGIEITPHGSTIGIRKILNLFLANGFRMAEPGEFAFRSFLAGKIDLTKAEAINELVFSKTNKAHSFAVKRLSSGLFSKIDQVKKDILNFLSAISVYLDYETDDTEVKVPFDLISKSKGEIQKLLKSYEASKKIDKGIKLVLAGSVNVGKSSLFNLFLKEDRSIVSEYEGTTRDYIEANFELDGILFNLFDTAGIRETSNYVEQIGIEKSNSLISDAAIIIYVIDSSSNLSLEDKEFIRININNEKVIFVLNKIDLVQNESTMNEVNSFINSVKLSTKNLEGIHDLYLAIRELAAKEEINIEDDIIISSSRQKELLNKAYSSLLEFEEKISKGLSYDMLAFDAYEIINFLGEITGEVRSEDVLDNMFANFCLGK